MADNNENRGLPLLRTWGLDVVVASVAILAIHGRDQTSGLMQEYARRFGDIPGRFYAPEAQRNSWYPQPFLNPIDDNQPDLDQALQILESSLDVIEKDGFTRDRIIVWGFSQGACLLSQWLISHAPGVAGAILHTGGYLGPKKQAPAAQFPAKTQIIMRSIQRDPFVPAQRVLETRDVLKEMGADVDCRVDPGHDHIITDEAFQASASLIHKLNAVTD